MSITVLIILAFIWWLWGAFVLAWDWTFELDLDGGDLFMCLLFGWLLWLPIGMTRVWKLTGIALGRPVIWRSRRRP